MLFSSDGIGAIKGLDYGPKSFAKGGREKKFNTSFLATRPSSINPVLASIVMQ